MGKRQGKEEEEYDGSKPLPDSRQEFFCVIFTTNTLPNFWGHGQNSYEFAYGHSDRIDKIDDEIKEAYKLRSGTKKQRKGKSMAQLDREIELKREQISKIHRSCRAASSRLLTSVSIKSRCAHLMDQLASHLIVDRELLYTIQQRDDLNVKIHAIEHHDKRAQRIREKVDIKHEFEPIKVITIATPTKK